MNRFILRVSIRPNFWVLPYFWRNRYRYVIRRAHPSRTEGAVGHRAVWLCFDLEFARLPTGAYWNPDGTHLAQPGVD